MGVLTEQRGVEQRVPALLYRALEARGAAGPVSLHSHSLVEVGTAMGILGCLLFAALLGEGEGEWSS